MSLLKSLAFVMQWSHAVTSISLAEYKKQYAPKSKPRRKSKRQSRGVKVESEGEATLSRDLKASKIAFEREFQFHPKRKWRADFHLIDQKILIEVEGGIWSNGRHTRAKGYLGDMEKYNAATALGYRIFRYSTEQVKSGMAIKEIMELVGK